MDFIKQFHSGWAYLVILMGVIFVISTLIYAISKKDTNATIKKIGLFTTITFHVQLLLGLVNLIKLAVDVSGAENIMKNDILRFKLMEHPLIMISAVIFMTIANAKLKRSITVPMSVPIFAIVSFLLVALGVFFLYQNQLWLV
ncbi:MULTISPECIES: hypothetical protein [Empedobacter]|uniref:50S ribosomal protein L27 n=1 Tax=Empedobacter falsenii TaxID=343874 RepID=A0A376G2H5_9FLAO|nr:MULTISPECIES: hypothetical protein [Empedobacter]MBW1617481.1 hypothetical protein [Empedobacter falsenii]STD53702.1 Uncharacterised protein [Empedobacter falsenii]